MSHLNAHGSLSRVKDRIQRHFGDMLSPDDAFLSYHDVRLTREDVEDVKKGEWFTDTAIAFWEEFLEHEFLRKSYPDARINLLRPSMVFMLLQTPDPLSLKDALPSFDDSTHIFCPINDCTSPNLPEGGSHWSLLVISLHGANIPNAQIVTTKLGQLVNLNIQFSDLVTSPQQANGSDCGAFVCAEMEYLLLERLLQRRSAEMASMNLTGMEVDASSFRRKFVKTAESFRRDGKSRSRSRSKSKSPPRIGD